MGRDAQWSTCCGVSGPFAVWSVSWIWTIPISAAAAGAAAAAAAAAVTARCPCIIRSRRRHRCVTAGGEAAGRPTAARMHAWHASMHVHVHGSALPLAAVSHMPQAVQGCLLLPRGMAAADWGMATSWGMDHQHKDLLLFFWEA